MVALAYNFESMRTAASRYFINVESCKNAGVAVVPLLKGADMPVMTLNQAKMLLLIAAIYENEIGLKLVPEMIGLTVCAFGLKTAANKTKHTFKDFRVLISAAFGFAGTQLLGYMCHAAFSHGASVQNLFKKIMPDKEQLQKLTQKIK